MKGLSRLLFFLWCVLLPYTTISQETKPTLDYQSKLTELTKVLERLSDYNQSLMDKLKVLTQDSSVWETKYLEVEAQLTLWEKDYQALRIQFLDLERTYSNLGTDYQNLKQSLIIQQEEFKKLKDSWEKLKKDFDKKLVITGIASGAGGLTIGSLLVFFLTLIF